MSASGTSSPIPSGCKVFSSFPDALMVGEIVFGSLVWILVASTDFLPEAQEFQGWLMFVSVTCHVVTTLLLIIYMCGAQNHSSVWITLLDLVVSVFAFIATLFYAVHTIGSMVRWKRSS
ncbi:myelin and lymphocyte protein-like [Mobula hypostoma]|uniref:myelin and lymphocyte protein-like n=1 Tax=Mobula hypostoma TaxID=723540 RepID=UPI002FC2A621